MARSANVGRIEIGEDSIVHPAYPHLIIALPVAGGTAHPAGTALQMDGSGALAAGDFSKRTYIALEETTAISEEVLVLAMGAARAEMVLAAGAPLTRAEAIALMEKSPLTLI